MKKIKSILFILLLMLVCSIAVYSQARKPIIMVVPSDNWCNEHGYMTEYNDQGIVKKFPDYQAALQDNTDLQLMISKIGELMIEREFPLKRLDAALRTLQRRESEDAVLTSKNSAELRESPLDRLKREAQADIWMQLTWRINQRGPEHSVTFILDGIDIYTDKQIATATGTGKPSFAADLPILLEEAVLEHLDNFNSQLMAHFDDMFENGREIILRIITWDSFDGDLESEYDGEELRDIIETWVNDNTVQNRFSTTDATENRMLFEQVRIPLYNEQGRALDARTWANGLQKMLKNKYAVSSKLMMQGLGQVKLVIGEK